MIYLLNHIKHIYSKNAPEQDLTDLRMLMNRTYFKLSLTLLLALLITFSNATFGRKHISDSDKVVFVYTKNRSKNFIVIPNFGGKLHAFKIYRKLKSETEFSFLVEKKRPALPSRGNWPDVYSVHWEDPEYHSSALDYKIICYDKKGNDCGEMEILWEAKINPGMSSKQKRNKTRQITINP